MEVEERPFDAPFTVFDLAVGDGGKIYLSNAAKQWTDVSVVDTTTSGVVAQAKWRRLVALLPASQPRWQAALRGQPGAGCDAGHSGIRSSLPERISDKPATTKATANAQYPLGGDFVITPDGRYLLFKSGTVVRLSTDPVADMQGHANLGPFAAAAIDPDTKLALLLACDGTLKAYSYPEFRLLTTHRLNILPTQGRPRRTQRQALRRRRGPGEPGRATSRSWSWRCGDLRHCGVASEIEEITDLATSVSRANQ